MCAHVVMPFTVMSALRCLVSHAGKLTLLESLLASVDVMVVVNNRRQ